MKKIVLLGFITLCLSLGSCVNEVEEIFDGDSLRRLEEHRLKCREMLCNAPHGWLIEYFPSEDLAWGGFVFGAKFYDDGTVSVTGEVADELGRSVEDMAISHYKISTHNNIILSFDTYNDYIHYLSDPDMHGGNKYDGEFEFVFVEGNDSKLVFRGAKTGNRVVFTSFEEEGDMFEYIYKVQDVANNIEPQLYHGYNLTIGNKTLTLDGDFGFNGLYYYPKGKDFEAEFFSFIYKDWGIHFYNPIELNGVVAQNFEWSANDECFRSLDAKDNAGTTVEATLKGFHFDGFVHYDKFLGAWDFIYDDGKKVLEVELIEKEKYKSFYMKGFSSWGDVVMNYDNATGDLTFTDQVIAKDGSYNIRLCGAIFNPNGSYSYGWGANAGFILHHNQDADNLQLSFDGTWNNDDGTDQHNGVILRRFNGGSNGDYTYATYPRLHSMVKK